MPQHKPMLGTKLDWPDYLATLQKTLESVDFQQLRAWSDWMYAAYQEDQQVFIIGNGGSGTNAAHFCQDFSKSTTPEDRSSEDGLRRLRTLNLTDHAGWILSIGNDLGYDQIFEQQLRTLGRTGDILICLSGSGNSPNILNSVQYARTAGIRSLALTGFDGGKLRTVADQCVHVPIDDMGIAESVHLCLFHWVLDDVYAKINKTGRYSETV